MRADHVILHFDPTNYLRLEDPRAIDTSAAGASFATSTGDIVEVTSYGTGVFRLRIGPRTRPDYGAARVALGVLMHVAGPRPEALKLWQEALRRDPSNKAAEMYLRIAQNPPVSTDPPRAT